MEPAVTPTGSRFNVDFWAGVFFAAVGFGAGIVALQYPLGRSGQMGPGYLPLVLSGLLVVFGALIGISGLCNKAGERPKFMVPTAATIVTSVIAFGLLLDRLGLVIAVPSLVVVSRLVGGDRHWGEILALSAFLALFTIGVFVWALGGPMPVWPT